MGSVNLLKLETWVDVSHAVHEGMRGHTGSFMSCGVGSIHGKASKQKLNTEITIESEVVAVSEYCLTKFTLLIFWGEKAMFYTKTYCIKTTKVQLI